jgi:hypothetical protein
MHYKFIVVILISSLSLYAQNTDSLFNVYTHFHSQTGAKSGNQVKSISPDTKCGFSISNTIRENYNLFTADQQKILSNILERPGRQKSIVSPAGLFRIHYDTTGSHKPAYFPGMPDEELVQMSVDSLAAAFDYSYDYEVNFLGYGSPLVGDGLGGDNLYDIYITDMGYYGETTTDAGSSGSYIKIDNDFIGSGFYTTGIDAAKVTAAHEFHHAVQLANYGFYGTETEFYELTSTAMEEFVYDYVNDYYSWLNSYFSKPYNTFKEFSGYDLPIFYLYLHQKYANDGDDFKGHAIIKRAWDLFGSVHKSVDAISSALFEFGTSLKNEWNEFGIWCYFTGNRIKAGEYFEEAANYPLIRPFSTYQFVPPVKQYSFNTEPISNNYIFFEITKNSILDTLVSIITNADIENGKASPFTNTEIFYTLTTQDQPGAQKIVNEYKSLIEAPMNDLFKEGNIFSNEVVAGGDINHEVLDYAFPQPFRYSNNSSIYIPTEPNTLGFAYFNIFTIGMDLIYAGKADIIKGDKIVIQWNALDNNGSKLPSGVYLYVTKSDDKITKGKLIIYND